MSHRLARHRRTIAQLRVDNDKMIAALDAGTCPKAIAQELGIGIQAVYHQARSLGYRMLLVRQEMLNSLILTPP